MDNTFFVDEDGTFRAGIDLEAQPGWTVLTEAEYNAGLDALFAAGDAAEAAAQTANLADAQAVYDDLVGNHPTAALILAKRIYAPFTP